jgi:hypothetical protein
LPPILEKVGICDAVGFINVNPPILPVSGCVIVLPEIDPFTPYHSCNAVGRLNTDGVEEPKVPPLFLNGVIP